MLVRSFTGGVVFSGNKVLLRKCEDGWVLPREKLQDGELPNEVVLKKISQESGSQVEIISNAGQTNYEYFPMTCHSPFLNKTTWYIMKSLNDKINEEHINKNSAFINIDEAMSLMKYSQDKSLVNLSFMKYREMEQLS